MTSLATLYDTLYMEAQQKGWNGWGGDQRLAKGPEQVKKILAAAMAPSSGTALELGCGEGHLCRLLYAHGFRVTGVDISEVAIDWAKSKDVNRGVRYLQVDLCAKDALQGEAFDLVVDGNCLHCIAGSNRPVFLRNVRRLLSPGGMFYVSSLCTKQAASQSTTVFRDGRPFRYVPTPQELLDEIHQSGFTVHGSEFNERDAEFNHANVWAGGA